MEHVKMKTKDMADENFKKLAALFPNCVTEVIRKDEDGNDVIEHAIDKDKLAAEINGVVVDGPQERYQFNWPGKRDAIRTANAPSTMTLRPCKEESVDFDNTQNLYIEGDNLEVLKLLQNNYLGKVKMIYIDPPYNTGNDFVYNDDFKQDADLFNSTSGMFDENGNMTLQNFERNSESNGRFHTDWLNMMYPRLKIARNLLKEDGVIFISIDDNEVANLKRICDEIFGEHNFVSNIVWQSTAGSNTGTDIVTVTENALVYTRNRSEFRFDGMLSDESSFSLSDEFEAERGKYSLDKLDRRRVGSHYSEALNFPITMPDGTVRYPGGTTEKTSEGWNYLWSKTKVQWGLDKGFIVFKQNDNGEWSVYNKRYAKIDNEGNYVERSIPFRNLITSNVSNTAQGTKEIRDLFDSRPFDFPKPTSFLKQLLLTAVRSCKDALVLDFFSGSATTAHAVMLLNAEDSGTRKFICVQLPEQTSTESEAYLAGYKTICEIGKERIRRAGKKIKEDAESAAQNLDVGFRVLKLAESNMTDVFYKPGDLEQGFLGQLESNVKADRTDMDLLFQVMLECDLPLSSKIEEKTIQGKKVFFVESNELVACFADGLTTDAITEIAKTKPYYFITRDSALANDNTADNFEQIWSAYSKDTIRKVL